MIRRWASSAIVLLRATEVCSGGIVSFSVPALSCRRHITGHSRRHKGCRAAGSCFQWRKLHFIGHGSKCSQREQCRKPRYHFNTCGIESEMSGNADNSNLCSYGFNLHESYWLSPAGCGFKSCALGQQSILWYIRLEFPENYRKMASLACRSM